MAKRQDVAEPTHDGIKPIDPANPAQGLDDLYKALIEKAEGGLAWYRSARKWKSIFSYWIRFWAIVLFALAGLVPVLTAAGITWQPSPTFQFGQLGYVAAALAAAILGLDKYFGYSSGWVRYMLADSDIRRAMAEFQMNWIIANTCLEHDPEEQKCGKKRLQLLKDFSLKITDLIDAETRQWAAEFQGSLAVLEKSAKDAQDALRPGNISITIRRGATVNAEVTISLDGREQQKSPGNTVLLTGVSPGPHQIGASGTKQDGSATQDGKTVVVTAGATTNIELTLA